MEEGAIYNVNYQLPPRRIHLRSIRCLTTVVLKVPIRVTFHIFLVEIASFQARNELTRKVTYKTNATTTKKFH